MTKAGDKHETFTSYLDPWLANPFPPPPRSPFAESSPRTHGQPQAVYPPGSARQYRRETIAELARSRLLYNPLQHPLLEALCRAEEINDR